MAPIAAHVHPPDRTVASPTHARQPMVLQGAWANDEDTQLPAQAGRVLDPRSMHAFKKPAFHASGGDDEAGGKDGSFWRQRDAEHPYNVGTRVLHHLGGSTWWPAEVGQRHANGTYELLHFDKHHRPFLDHGHGPVPSWRFKLAYTAGTAVLADPSGGGEWHPALVQEMHADGTHTLVYDDPSLPSGPPLPAERLRYALTRGTHVWAKDWEAAKTWHHALIEANRGDGTFDVQYDDLDRQGERIPGELIWYALIKGTDVQSNWPWPKSERPV